jgi:hypothetical protein
MGEHTMDKVYTLMHKAVPVADIVIEDRFGELTGIQKMYEKEHFPVGTLFSGKPSPAALGVWWRGRGIPASRSGLQDALISLGLSKENELQTKGFGLSLSDHYWVRPKDRDIAWKDVNFFENPFSADVGDALFGRRRQSKQPNLMSPDSTSDGWLQKRWVIDGTKRKLIKGGSRFYYQEPVNEVIASRIMFRLGIPHVKYDMVLHDRMPYSVCETFVNKDTELVSAWMIYNTLKQGEKESEYEHFVNCCKTLGIPGATKSLSEMLALDYLIVNTDRHYGNFGALRRADTLEWLGMAPVFDSGTSLWHNYPENQINFDYEGDSKPFDQYHSRQIKLAGKLDWIQFDKLQGISEEFGKLLEKNVYINENRRTMLCKGLESRIEKLQKIAVEQGIKRNRHNDYDMGW